MTIKGSDITVGTTLRMLEKIGNYYPATVEVLRTVDSVYTNPSNGSVMMTFANQYPKYEWYVDLDKDYETESQGRTWLDGDPSTPSH